MFIQITLLLKQLVFDRCFFWPWSSNHM